MQLQDQTPLLVGEGSIQARLGNVFGTSMCRQPVPRFGFNALRRRCA